VKIALRAYDALWRLLPPLLKRNPRLREGFAQRMLQTPLPRAELWLHAASAGESYLAESIAQALIPVVPQGARLRILTTTNTCQGHDILSRAGERLAGSNAPVALFAAYCPFDRPSLMRAAMTGVNPAVVALLETELWPGLMASAREHGATLVVANARMSPRTLARSLPLAGLLRPFGPHEVLAISKRDANRYTALFPNATVTVTPNIKFDQLRLDTPPNPPQALSALLPGDAEFVVFGSVREPEETAVTTAMAALLDERPQAVIGLFPRHMERLRVWQERLQAAGLRFYAKTALDGPAAPGSIILWDAFGELRDAYSLARAAFLGGSLAPLGGQNFLEPLAAGTPAVIGPHWKNFAWVGREIVDAGLVREVRDASELAPALADICAAPQERKDVRSALAEYVRPRQGGAQATAARLATLLAERGAFA